MRHHLFNCYGIVYVSLEVTIADKFVREWSQFTVIRHNLTDELKKVDRAVQLGQLPSPFVELLFIREHEVLLEEHVCNETDTPYISALVATFLECFRSDYV